MWSKLGLILWKSYIARKRGWRWSLTEILIPVLLFSLAVYARAKIIGTNSKKIIEPTYDELMTTEDIYNSRPDVGEDFNLCYSPHTNFTETIIIRVQEKLQIRTEVVNEFSSKSELLKHVKVNNRSRIAAVNFNINNPHHLDYDLSIYDKYLTWNTDKLYNSMFVAGGSWDYINKGFIAFQVAINMAFIELSLNKSATNIAFSVQKFPEPPRTDDSGVNEKFMHFWPLITIFSFIFLCPSVLKRVGEEKQSGTKEFMKMVGLKSWVIWFGWFFHALTTNLFSIIVIIVLMKVSLFGVPYPPIEHSDGTVLFVFLFLYCMAAITFCFFIASIVTTPSKAINVGMLVWFFSYFFPQLINSFDNLPWKYRIPFAIFPNMAVHYGYSSISVYEMREIGIQWYNIFLAGSGDENDVTMGSVFVMFICDSLIFMLLTLYIENVNPGKYGIAKPYWFPLTNLNDFLKKCIPNRIQDGPELLHLQEEGGENPTVSCIEIRHLYKKFGNNIAIDHLDMIIRKNQITVLLGQNGAGKTTTMSILAGMINATGGDIKVNGKDIKKHTDEVRNLMGLCPQHNLFFPNLTVEEHLTFFAKLKNLPKPREECDSILKTLDLSQKRKYMTSKLSGGMKRKLSLGMALIGNSPVLILDAPTSGMDRKSRQKVWDLLLKYRKTRTILITTQFMEEADVLGDLVAIMTNGSLQCYDTPLHLKMEYNSGCRLSLTLNSKRFLESITSKVKENIPEAELILETEYTVVYLLPLNQELYETKHREIVDSLKTSKEELDIIAVGLNLPILNEVFLKANDEIVTESENKIDPLSSTGIPVFRQNLNGNLYYLFRLTNIFGSLLMKRCYFLKRKYYWFILPIVVTLGILWLSIWIAMANHKYYNGGGPELKLTLEAYDKPLVFYGGSNSSNTTVNNLREFYHDIVSREHGDPTPAQQVVSEGIIEKGKDNLAFYRQYMIVAAEFNEIVSSDEIKVNSMYSSYSLHGLPISVNLAMNAIAKALLNSSFEITTRNSPIDYEASPSELSLVNVMSVWLILIPISMLFFMNNFVVFPNKEISTNFLDIQTMAGIRPFWYWCSNWLFDIAFSILPLLLVFLLMVLTNWFWFKSTAFQPTEMWTIIAMLFFYIVASLPFTYLLSYNKTITGGFSILFVLGIFIGIIPTVIVVVMEFSRQDCYIQIAKILKHVFLCISPHFGLSYMCVQFSKKYVENFNWKYLDPNKRNLTCPRADPNPCCSGDTTQCHSYQNYFLNKDSGLLEIIGEMLVPLALYFIILSFMHMQYFEKFAHVKNWLSCLHNPSKLKESIEPNEIEIEISPKGKNREEALSVKNLSKTYGQNKIVDKLKFELKKNKCFGLLGINGAGKSTTLRMLTKLLPFDEGEVILFDNKDISIKESEYCKKIGYCPQEDCLNYILTGRELLHSMARLKDYSTQEAKQITDLLIKHFGMEKYADIPSIQYSRGNKRNLSTSIALLGDPKVIMLDEPTSGVDPANRRNFWNVLASFKNTRDTSFLLCSHNIQECENLCDEIAIMKKGQIEEQGSPLDLKNKHQEGFKIKIKLKSGDDNLSSIKELITDRLNATLLQEYAELMEFKMDGTNRLSQLFEKLQVLKDESEGQIEDYTINQMSLEDIFLMVTKEEEEEGEGEGEGEEEDEKEKEEEEDPPPKEA